MKSDPYLVLNVQSFIQVLCRKKHFGYRRIKIWLFLELQFTSIINEFSLAPDGVLF